MRRTIEETPSKEKVVVLAALDKAAQRFSGGDAVAKFIREVLTEGEKLVIGRRLAVAQMILAGCTYYEIRNRLHVSPNTFSRINKWLDELFPDYERVSAAEKRGVKERREKRRPALRAEYVDPLSFKSLRRKYPMHFLLFNIAEELLKLKSKE